MHHVNAVTVGKRIRELRHKAGLSQGDLELRTNVPKARQSRYENGHVMPSIETADRIAGGLGLTLADLLRGI